MADNKTEIKKLGFLGSFAIYIPAAVLLYGLTKYVIPHLSTVTGQEIILFWFIVAGLGIFIPMIITAVLILRVEGYGISETTWRKRLRFRKLSKGDVIRSITGLIMVAILSGIIMKGLVLIGGKFDHSPAFMSFEPLNKGRYWLLLIWLPY